MQNLGTRGEQGRRARRQRREQQLRHRRVRRRGAVRHRLLQPSRCRDRRELGRRRLRRAAIPRRRPTWSRSAGRASCRSTNTGTRNATETVWSGAGSGCSAYEPKPAWQTDAGCANRTVADVVGGCRPEHRRVGLQHRRRRLGGVRRNERRGADHRRALRAGRQRALERRHWARTRTPTPSSLQRRVARAATETAAGPISAPARRATTVRPGSAPPTAPTPSRPAGWRSTPPPPSARLLGRRITARGADEAGRRARPRR